MLPFMGEQELYGRFKIDEPWDSEHNLKLVDEMPSIFASGPESAEGKTRFHAIVTPNGLMSLATPRIRDCQEGTSNTPIFIHVGREKAVPWTKPGGIGFDGVDIVKSFGTSERSKYFFAVVNAEVNALSAEVEPDYLSKLIDHNDMGFLPDQDKNFVLVEGFKPAPYGGYDSEQ